MNEFYTLYSFRRMHKNGAEFMEYNELSNKDGLHPLHLIRNGSNYIRLEEILTSAIHRIMKLLKYSSEREM